MLDSMNNTILEIARKFDQDVLEVRFVVKFRNTIYKAICKEYNFILRLTNQNVRTKGQIESELNFQHYLFANNANVTKPLSTDSGDKVIMTEIEGEQYFVSAFSFAYGKHWDERVDEAPETFFIIGKALGKIHKLSKSYKPNDIKRRMWYEQQELIEAEHLFKNYKMELYDSYANFINVLKSLNTDSENFGLTHGDYLMSNYLIDNNNVMVIDFDECEYSWYAMDLAICIRCYLVGDEPEKVNEKREQAEMIHYNLLLGYKTENTITSDMIYDLNKYIRVRDYIEIAQIFRLMEQGRELCDIEKRLLVADMDRVLHNKPFLEFDLDRVSKIDFILDKGIKM